MDVGRPCVAESGTCNLFSYNENNITSFDAVPCRTKFHRLTGNEAASVYVLPRPECECGSKCAVIWMLLSICLLSLHGTLANNASLSYCSAEQICVTDQDTQIRSAWYGYDFVDASLIPVGSLAVDGNMFAIAVHL